VLDGTRSRDFLIEPRLEETFLFKEAHFDVCGARNLRIRDDLLCFRCDFVTNRSLSEIAENLKSLDSLQEIAISFHG